MTRRNGSQPSEVQRTPHTTTCFSLNTHVEQWPSCSRSARSGGRGIGWEEGKSLQADSGSGSGGGARAASSRDVRSTGLYEPMSGRTIVYRPYMNLPDPCRCTCTCLPVKSNMMPCPVSKIR